MYVRTYVCMCMYVHACTSMYMHIHACTCIYVHVYVRTCMYMQKRVYVYIRMRSCILYGYYAFTDGCLCFHGFAKHKPRQHDQFDGGLPVGLPQFMDEK